jgi:hypothetical protein
LDHFGCKQLEISENWQRGKLSIRNVKEGGVKEGREKAGRPLVFQFQKKGSCQIKPENDKSWLQKDDSWRRATTHGRA